VLVLELPCYNRRQPKAVSFVYVIVEWTFYRLVLEEAERTLLGVLEMYDIIT